MNAFDPAPVDETSAELAAIVADTANTANTAHPAAAASPATAVGAEVGAASPVDATMVESPAAAVLIATPAAALPQPPSPPAQPARRPRTALRFGVSFIAGLALVTGIGAGALYAWSHQYDGRILPGVHAGSLDLSGMTPDAARAAIAASWTHLGNGQIVLAGPAGNTVIKYGDIGRSADADTMLAEALAAGRQGALLADLIGAPRVALSGIDVAAEVTWNHGRLQTAIAAAATAIDKPAVDASVVVAADGSYRVTPSATGLATDQAAVLAAIESQLGSLDAPAEIDVQTPVGVVQPTISNSAASDAKASGDRMAWDLTLAYKSEHWTVSGAKIRNAISFAPAAGSGIAPVVDQAVLDPILAEAAKAINRKPLDARLTLVGRTVIVEKPSVDGLTVDLENTRSAVLDALAARQAGNTVPAVQLAVAVVQPAVNSNTAGSVVAGMTEISRWTTWFHVYDRNGFGANIWLPSTLLNGMVIAPGKSFDFMRDIGPITPARGFKPGNAIVRGKIDPLGAIGGGICSASTTMFNAALLGGFKILKRSNHYFYIDRYPVGLDATVSGSGPWAETTSWVNDTPNPVLIRGINTRKGGIGYVTFVLYSVPNGRKVVLDPPVIKNIVKAIPDVVYDPTIKAGVKKPGEMPINGMDVWRTVHVYQDGVLLRTYTFYSHYTAVHGTTLVGTKGAPAPTPTPAPSGPPIPPPSEPPTPPPSVLPGG